MIIVNFTPITAIVGGLLLGLSASLMLFLHGRVTGISGILAEMMSLERSAVLWRLLFVLGLIGGSWLGLKSELGPPFLTVTSNGLMLAMGGFAVGFGALVGGGCTSGHGICGVARFSKRSILATLIFMLVAMLVVYVKRHIM